MKSCVLLLLLLTGASAYCQNTLTVSDPNSWATPQQGTIDEAILEIRPAGAYLEYSLELSFSSSNTSYTSVQDTVEAVLKFELPAGAIIHDSWLWVGPDIVQGLLIERNMATNIYEGIVNRRRDPSILYKNNDSQYELRVFPMAGNESRRVKIKYLLPAKFTSSEMSTNLPIGLIKSSKTIPDFLVVAHANSTYQNPVIHGSNYLPVLNGPDSLNRYATIIPAATIGTMVDAWFAFQSPLQNGIFTAYYPQTQQSGYYQVVVDPSTLSPDSTTPKKLVYIIHHEPNISNIGYPELLYWSKVFLNQHLSPNDSFNLVFTSNTNTLYKNFWVQATPANIDSAFLAVTNQSVYLQAATFGQKITIANNFIQTTGGVGRMFLATNHNNTYSNQQVAAYLQNVNSTYTFMAPLDVINYFDARSGHDAYSKALLTQLADMFNGEYIGMDLKLIINSNWSYYYQCTETLTDLFDKYFASANGNQLYYYDIYPTLANGLTYSRYSLDDYNVTGQAKVQVGKYWGNMPFDITINAYTDSGFVTKQWNAVQPYDTDTFSRKIWGGVYIATIEDNSSSASLYQTAVDTSKAYRVLSRTTAFLCLEPSDTISVCEGCQSFEDENGDWVLIGVNEQISSVANEIIVSAHPNPFDDNLTVTIEVPEQFQGADISLSIVDLLGRVVATGTINTHTGESTYTFNWNGNSLDNNAAPAGIYILNAQVGSQTHTLKIVKTN
jgi:Ca-activated chloride channel family protein